MVQGSGSKQRDWGLVLSGIILIAFALVIMAWPGATLVTIAIMTGVLLLLSGIADVVFYARFRNAMERPGWVIVNAVLDILLGGMFLLHPIITASILPWLAGIFVIAYGIIAIASSFAFRPMGSLWVIMLLNGIVSVLIGVLLMGSPAYFVIFIGVYLLMRGIVMCISGVSAPRRIGIYK